jgi:DinB superfamily
MDAVTLLRDQLTRVNAILHDVVGDLRPGEWTARAAPGQNRLGFTLWHIPASQDWTVHTWIRNVAEVRDREPWARVGSLDRLGLAFGMSLVEADAIAEGVGPADTLAYADAVLAEILAWLSPLSDADLARVPDSRAHLTRHPAYGSARYRAEVQGMWDQPLGPLIAGDVGHGRAHLGEARLVKELVRGRGAA